MNLYHAPQPIQYRSNTPDYTADRKENKNVGTHFMLEKPRMAL